MNEDLLDYRLQAVEKDMKDLRVSLDDIKQAVADMKSKGVDPKVYAAIFGCISVIVSTFGSVVTTIIMSYTK